MTKNSKGQIFYGMHFYPGVAEYRDDGEAYRVFLNENTIRKMGPTFAGRPVFVHHVDDVSPSLDKLKEEADGWVIKSFFNEADGKHWVEFVMVSEKGIQAIKRGYRLSNCYNSKGFGAGGEWNGVSYNKEILDGEYEHLAIVPNPRYEESVIMTPTEFKAYNESKKLELDRLTNDKGDKGMKFFKRSKVENSADIADMVVILPKSNREVAITALVNEADEMEISKGKPRFANSADKVKVGDEEMTVGELVTFFNAKKDCVENEDDENEDDEKEDEERKENDDMDVEMENADDESAKEKAEDLVEHEEKEIEEKEKKKNKKKNDKEKADRLRNAPKNQHVTLVKLFDPQGALSRGKERYG